MSDELRPSAFQLITHHSSLITYHSSYAFQNAHRSPLRRLRPGGAGLLPRSVPLLPRGDGGVLRRALRHLLRAARRGGASGISDRKRARRVLRAARLRRRGGGRGLGVGRRSKLRHVRVPPATRRRRTSVRERDARAGGDEPRRAAGGTNPRRPARSFRAERRLSAPNARGRSHQKITSTHQRKQRANKRLAAISETHPRQNGPAFFSRPRFSFGKSSAINL